MNTDPMPLLRRNEELLRRSQFLNLDFGIEAGVDRHLVHVREGAVTVRPWNEGDVEPAFTIAAGAPAWEEFSRPEPGPGFNDVIAMIESGHGELRGNEPLQFFGNLLFVKGVVAAMFKGDATW